MFGTGASANVAYSSGSNQVSAPQSPSPIRDGVAKTEDLVSQLHAVISEVEKRFEGVLIPVGPSTQGDKGTPAQAGSDITCRVRMVNNGIGDAIGRLITIIGRAEV